jgi:hypothetical protein
MKTILTAVGKKQARIGYKFRYLGPCENYESCEESLRKVCVSNLEKNHVYEVIEIRKVEHKCNVHKDGIVIVMVKPVPFTVAIKSNFAYAGSNINYRPFDCDEVDCELYDYCVPIEFDRNSETKCRITEIVGRKTNFCKIHSDLSIVKIEKV